MLLVAISSGIFEKIKDLFDELQIKYEWIENGEELLEKAKKIRPQCILLEKDLPLLDGFAAVLLLKSNPKTKEIPVITICKCQYPEEEIKARDSGADYVLPWPLNKEELKRVLKSCFKK